MRRRHEAAADAAAALGQAAMFDWLRGLPFGSRSAINASTWRTVERIDALEGELARTQACLRELAAGRPLQEPCRGEAQNLMDREILEFLGE